MRWVIHIGPQKTGSKALQQFLLQQQERILSPRVVFPAEGRQGVWHQSLHNALLEGDSSAVATAVEHYREGADLGIWSYEGLHELPAASVALFREALGEAQVVLFLRRQDERINSFLNQLVKAHRAPIEWIEAFEASILEYKPAFDYRATILSWAASFGMDAITPLIYDKRVGVVEPFCRATGITLAPASASSLMANEQPVNPALDVHGYRVLREMKAQRPSPEQLPDLVTRTLQHLTSSFVDTSLSEGVDLIGDEDKRAIMALYAESNEWVRSRWYPETKWPEPGSRVERPESDGIDAAGC